MEGAVSFSFPFFTATLLPARSSVVVVSDIVEGVVNLGAGIDPNRPSEPKRSFSSGEGSTLGLLMLLADSIF